MTDAMLTLGLAAAVGVASIVVADRLRVPAIVLLLLVGILLGPSGIALIDPRASLGQGMQTVISMAVAVILFEGGLTLDIAGYSSAPRVIRRMLTMGSLITWIGTSAAVYFLFDTGAGLALMAGSLVIVTGPTVVSPLLRRLRLPERVHHVLYWEGVLIDAVGVFVAVLCYEWLTPAGADDALNPIARFAMRIAAGGIIGIVSGFAIATILKQRDIRREHANIIVLAGALFTFAVSHALIHESGILAVIIAGLVVALKRPPHLLHVKRFKLAPE